MNSILTTGNAALSSLASVEPYIYISVPDLYALLVSDFSLTANCR